MNTIRDALTALRGPDNDISIDGAYQAERILAAAVEGEQPASLTNRQRSLARMAVALLLANVRHKGDLNVYVVMDAFSLAGFGQRDRNPLAGVTEEELTELLTVLRE